jgi:hypothetical protein
VLKRLRRLEYRSLVLPAVLFALMLRALVPSGLAPSGDGFTVTSLMCAETWQSPADEKSESIEVPGFIEKLHCEFCVSPVAGAAPIMPPMLAASPVQQFAPTFHFLRRAPDLVARAQSARAPPAHG